MKLALALSALAFARGAFVSFDMAVDPLLTPDSTFATHSLSQSTPSAEVSMVLQAPVTLVRRVTTRS